METSNPTWNAVDDYFSMHLIESDSVFDQVIRDNLQAELPAYEVTALQGKFLQMLARLHSAKRVLEIGTLGGYSTIWLAKVLPEDGQLITLEIDQHYADVARKNFETAGVADLVELRLGVALTLLEELCAEKVQPFDFVFIDADKQSNKEYFEWALKLTRPGGVILIDNTVRNGEVINTDSEDESVLGTRRLVDAISACSQVTCTCLQTVGKKGYDGFIMSIVK